MWSVRPAAGCGGGLITGTGGDGVAEIGTGDGDAPTVELDAGVVSIGAPEEANAGAFVLGTGVVPDGAQLADMAATASSANRTRSHPAR